MSLHRKIEYALSIIGAVGCVYAGYLILNKIEGGSVFGYPTSYLLIAFLVVLTLFAKLHVFHVIDGKLANGVVIAFSTAGVALSAYFFENQFVIFFVNLLLLALALRLHKDFVKKL